jgi:hypothetical protein
MYSLDQHFMGMGNLSATALKGHSAFVYCVKRDVIVVFAVVVNNKASVLDTCVFWDK